MFKEDLQAVERAAKKDTIPAGEYEANITKVLPKKAAGEGKAGGFNIIFTVNEGEYEGCEYLFFLTKSAAAAGVRAGFYRNVGYVMPEDGNVDENGWLGLPGRLVIAPGPQGPKVMRVLTSKNANADNEDNDKKADDESPF